MARLLKKSEIPSLVADTNMLSSTVREYVNDRVRYSPEILDAVIDQYGSNASIALALTGATSKQDNKYKAAMRWLQYTRKGQTKYPSLSKYAPQLVTLLTQNDTVPFDILINTAHNQPNNASIRISGTIAISQIIEYRDNWHCDFPSRSSSYSFGDFLEAALVGNFDGYDVFAASGGYPPFAQVFNDVKISF